MTKPISVTRSSMPPLDEYMAEIREIWDTAWLTNMGPLHQRLEQRLVEYLGVDCVSLFANGHMALETAIGVLGLTGEVITTPFTFVSTTHAITRSGLKPVFCDISPEDYTIDVSRIEALITPKTSAILPVHVYGSVCDVSAIDGIAQRHGLKVIYDAAHAFGVTVDGRGIGGFGDASMFSFHATKVFNTIEGGAVTFSNHCYGEALALRRNFGIASPESVTEIGCNAKMNEFQAAMGLCNLRGLDAQLERRRMVVERYAELLSGVEGLRLMAVQAGVKPNFSYFPVVFDEASFGKCRDRVFEDLRDNGIYARKYFYPLVSDMECYRGEYSSSVTPVATYIADRVLTLPLYADLALEDVDRICSIVLGKQGS